MSARSVFGVPQNRMEFALGMLSRLFIALPFAALGWWWLSDLTTALFILAMGTGAALGYAFAHGEPRFRRGLHSINAWAYAIGVILLICGLVGVAPAETTLVAEVIGIVLVQLGVVLLFFGGTLRVEARKLRPDELSGSVTLIG